MAKHANGTTRQSPAVDGRVEERVSDILFANSFEATNETTKHPQSEQEMCYRNSILVVPTLGGGSFFQNLVMNWPRVYLANDGPQYKQRQMQQTYKDCTYCTGYLLSSRRWCDLFVVMSRKYSHPAHK